MSRPWSASVLVARREVALRERVELGLVRAPAPASVLVQGDVAAGVEVERLEALLADPVLAIRHFTVPQVEGDARDVAEAAPDGLVERSRPCQVVLPLPLVHQERARAVLELAHRR